MRFSHEWRSQQVIFAPRDAAGALAGAVRRLGLNRVLLIAGPAEAGLADRVGAGLPVVARHDEVVMHVPADVVQRARAAVAAAGADGLVSLGGGSSTGLAKAVALTTHLPIVAVPTTYAGSEATSMWGITEDGRKTTGTDPHVLPAAIVYDASLTSSLPVELSVASGLNAVAHCVDSMWAPHSDPIAQMLAGEGLQALARGLPQVARAPEDITGRSETLYGAYLSGVAFASAGSGLHHKICHVLGGMFDLPHAQTHAVVLPHVLALNAPHAPAAAARIASALDGPTAERALEDLRHTLKSPRALRDLHDGPVDLAPAVEAIVAGAPADNPAPVTRETITRVLAHAWEGAEPA